MKVNKEKANKIIKIFKVKFPQLTVTDVYDSTEGTVVRALKDPEKATFGTPYYQIFDNGIVINANPFGRFDWFKKVTQESNQIYHNTDVDYPESPELKGGNE